MPLTVCPPTLLTSSAQRKDIPMHIFLTNDDGIQAAGLQALYTALIEGGHTVDVVAPITEQSAVSNSITFATPMRIKHYQHGDFAGTAVHGTPVDCAKLGLSSLVTQKPDLVLSGINRGMNAGPDVLYSGTVSAACEGALMGYRSIAVSFASYTAEHKDDFIDKARHLVALLPSINWENVPARSMLNINYPACLASDALGIRFCPQSRAIWHDWYEERQNPLGQRYWWINGEVPPESIEAGSDRDFLAKGYITITPLQFDFTDYNTLEILSKTSLANPSL